MEVKDFVSRKGTVEVNGRTLQFAWEFTEGQKPTQVKITANTSIEGKSMETLSITYNFGNDSMHFGCNNIPRGEFAGIVTVIETELTAIVESFYTVQ